MRVALAQVNPTVGDLEGNAALVIDRGREALRAGAEVVAFPELVISGYPPEDLLLKEHFLRECAAALRQVAASLPEVVALVGVPWLEGGSVYNAAAVLAGGEIAGLYRKVCLPNYAVFDEKRYFASGGPACVVDIGGFRLGVNICEDIWEADDSRLRAVASRGARVLINLSMSPYHVGKGRQRQELLARRASQAGLYVCYVNGVGGQDELVFDGQSMVLDPGGDLVARARQFQEETLVLDLQQRGDAQTARAGADDLDAPEVDIVQVAVPRAAARLAGRDRQGGGVQAAADCLSLEAEVYGALCLGVRDYVRKNRFTHVVLGMSGGIDSALTACVARDALGPDCVTAVSMPSRFSSAGTKNDARETAERLGIEFREIPIEGVFSAYLAGLEPHFAIGTQDVTEQNIQARIRGNLLMALSNKFGWLVLTTGNKSEMAVGYATLYGDMAGGFAVLKDVPKTLVYRLSRYRNELPDGLRPIPESTILRAPSAELAEDQTDQDTLPPYDVLDRIVEQYVERDESVDQIVAGGIARVEVERVVSMIDGNEYKRRQAAPGVRITPKAFGKDRRLPITNRYRG